ncbi:MAG: S8 family serine peptidase, partial [Myxococcota bacterium]
SPGSLLDRKPDQTPSGQVRTAGTSMAAAQVAGVAALLRRRRSTLTERAVRNVLMSTTKALQGRWQPEVGFGLVRGSRGSTNGPPGALEWLDGTTPQAYVRTTLTDAGLRALVASLDDANCPDIVVLNREVPDADVELRLGLAAKHVSGPEPVRRSGKRWVYVRFTNRSLVDHAGEVVVFSVDKRGDDYLLDEIGSSGPARPVAPGDFAVVGMGELSMDHDGLLVVVGDRPGELQARQLGSVANALPGDVVHSLVLANAGLGLRRLA